jgi:hypothetical protein
MRIRYTVGRGYFGVVVFTKLYEMIKRWRLAGFTESPSSSCGLQVKYLVGNNFSEPSEASWCIFYYIIIPARLGFHTTEEVNRL